MRKLLKFLKANLFFSIIILVYVTLAITYPHIAKQGIKNSSYYIKEMLMIMPVIFILTALLDSWVPKKMIMKTLGNESKIKGVLLSFLLGSISAGPIYAAFPVCSMLHNKGASIKNIVIILSSWAVIKVPMLLNEATFLGLDFMVFRWLLTLVAILIISWIMAKTVSDSDLPSNSDDLKNGLQIHRNACMGCSLCTRKYPSLFAMEGKKACVIKHDFIDENAIKEILDICPANAIYFN